MDNAVLGPSHRHYDDLECIDGDDNDEGDPIQHQIDNADSEEDTDHAGL